MSDIGGKIAISDTAFDRFGGDEIADLELVDRLRALLAADGGFTVHARTARPVRSGLAVCVYPAMTRLFCFAEWSDRHVLDWVRASRRFVRGGGGEDLFLGGWHAAAGDHVHLDIVRILAPDRRRAAERVGRLHRQHAVFDLANRVLVPLAVT